MQSANVSCCTSIHIAINSKLSVPREGSIADDNRGKLAAVVVDVGREVTCPPACHMLLTHARVGVGKMGPPCALTATAITCIPNHRPV